MQQQQQPPPLPLPLMSPGGTTTNNSANSSVIMQDNASIALPTAASASSITALYSGPMAIFSSHATRALADSKYDKRKSGALEVEGYVKALVLEQKRSGIACTEGVAKVCRRLAHDFVLAPDANKRKGGMIGLAAVAIGLGGEVGKFCELLLPAVLKCFEDPEAKVRYFAIEAMFNIAKVARQALLRPSATRFNCIYHGLCKVFADVDAEVKHGALLLDRQLKAIVSEASVGEFDLDGAVQLFQGYLKVKNPFIRQLLVGWICHLDSVPDLLLVNKLPLLLDGLLGMLSDSNKSIRDSVESCLAAFLVEVCTRVRQCNADNCKQAEYLLQTVVDICLRRRLDAQSKQVRLTCMHWLGEFMHYFGAREGRLIQARFFDFLRAVLDSVSETAPAGLGEEDMAVKLGMRLDAELVQSAIATENNCREEDEENLLKVCIAYMTHSDARVREICLAWVARLLDNQYAQRQQRREERATTTMTTTGEGSALIAQLAEMLTDVEDGIVLQAIDALARIARNTLEEEGGNRVILASILGKFQRDGALLEKRGPFIIRKLCALLHPVPVYLVLASLLVGMDRDALDFVRLMVQTLNVILLTSLELEALREKLKTDEQTFDALFAAWCHNPISALCLTLLSRAYPLAGSLVNVLGTVEVTVELLIDADRLVKLLESPVLLHVRMDLLKSGPGEFEPDLLKSLFGLLMILPQRSEAFAVLNSRLTSVTSMHISLNGNRNHAVASAVKNARFDKLCQSFALAQELHRQQRIQALDAKSLH